MGKVGFVVQQENNWSHDGRAYILNTKEPDPPGSFISGGFVDANAEPIINYTGGEERWYMHPINKTRVRRFNPSIGRLTGTERNAGLK